MQQTEETDLQQKLVKLWQPCPDSNMLSKVLNGPKLANKKIPAPMVAVLSEAIHF
jgi:hypothetical protein